MHFASPLAITHGGLIYFLRQKNVQAGTSAIYTIIKPLEPSQSVSHDTVFSSWLRVKTPFLNTGLILDSTRSISYALERHLCDHLLATTTTHPTSEKRRQVEKHQTREKFRNFNFVAKRYHSHRHMYCWTWLCSKKRRRWKQHKSTTIIVSC